MKRILILCMACIMLMSGMVSAEISKGRDSFTGGINVSSSARSPYLDTMRFSKNISGDVSLYELVITKANLNKYLLSDSPIELKIDDFPIFKLKDYKYRVLGPDSYGVEYNSIITADIPLEIIRQICVAQRVAMRFEDNDATQYPYILPESTLAEWKQVINTTDWDILESINKQK